MVFSIKNIYSKIILYNNKIILLVSTVNCNKYSKLSLSPSLGDPVKGRKILRNGFRIKMPIMRYLFF